MREKERKKYYQMKVMEIDKYSKGEVQESKKRDKDSDIDKRILF